MKICRIPKDNIFALQFFLKKCCIAILQIPYDITPTASCYIKALCIYIPHRKVCATGRDYGPRYHSFHFCSLSHTCTPERPSPAKPSGHRIHQRPPPLLKKLIKHSQTLLSSLKDICTENIDAYYFHYSHYNNHLRIDSIQK